jgi:glyoxylase-like metal-dependent hydrolase (beta-lactamase superfamily II)
VIRSPKPPSLQIGAMSLTPILDCVVRPPASAFYPGMHPEAWAVHRDLLTDDGRVEVSMGTYLLARGDRLVLVDAGVGPDGWEAPSGAKIPAGHLLENMRVAGVDPASVTDVVFTHLHPDHVGWAGRHGAPCFPNATYRCHRADWSHFVEGGADEVSRRLLVPLADRFELWEGAGSLLPGLDIVETPGHTPGSSTFVVSGDDGTRAVLLGDVVHCPVELLDDEWETIADVDPRLARETASRLAAELEGTDTVVGAAHFPGLRFGRLLPSTSGRRWKPVS